MRLSYKNQRVACLVLSALSILTSCVAKRAPDSARMKEFVLPSEFDFTAECGFTKNELLDPATSVFDGRYTSVPLEIVGSTAGVGFRVITVADVSINALLTQQTQNVNIRVIQAGPTSTSYLARLATGTIKGKADQGAKDNSGVVRATSVPATEWITMNSAPDSVFSGILCGGLGTASLNIQRTTSSANIVFSPAAILAINPKATLPRLQKEIGEQKTFPITATVSGRGKGFKTGTQSGTQTIRAIDPNININGETITADSAWEITFSFPGGAYSVGLPSRQSFYVDHQGKVFKAIINESDEIDDTTGKPLPPVYLIRSST